MSSDTAVRPAEVSNIAIRNLVRKRMEPLLGGVAG